MEIYSTVQRPLREIPLRKINPDGRDYGGGRERERVPDRAMHYYFLPILLHPSYSLCMLTRKSLRIALLRASMTSPGPSRPRTARRPLTLVRAPQTMTGMYSTSTVISTWYVHMYVRYYSTVAGTRLFLNNYFRPPAPPGRLA
jgi:hypothetical protein